MMRAQAERLLAVGAKAVLIKGGHGHGRRKRSIFSSTRRGSPGLRAARLATRNTHGTGCTLSSAIAAGLAKGLALADAVRDAKAYVTAAIAASDRLVRRRGARSGASFPCAGGDYELRRQINAHRSIAENWLAAPALRWPERSPRPRSRARRRSAGAW